MRKNLFPLCVLLAMLAATQTSGQTKTFTEKLEGIQTSGKELVKNASTDNSSIGQSGVMSTSVPLTTVSSRTMTFPLQLQYTSGITADQKSGPVGLGWVLPIGSIVRDYGAYEPDYSSTYHEADMKNRINETNPTPSLKGQFATMNGSIVNPASHHQYLGYDAIENVDARPMPLSDNYHINVAGALSNTFWNGGEIEGAHNWKLSEFENWKIEHSVKTYSISQEFTRINEINLAIQNGTMLKNSSFAAAIGVFPYVKNGFAKIPSTGQNDFAPSEFESVVRYEDFAQFVITDQNGTRYVFGRALHGQKFVFNDDPYWSNKDAGNAPFPAQGNFWKIDFIAEWLLTEIQSVDYVDLNNNHIADDEDAGDWIRFEYTDPQKLEYTYLRGAGTVDGQQMVPTHREWSDFSQTDQASSLMREQAYLKKIVTPTQQLDLTISERYDVEHDYYSKPVNRVNNGYFYEDRSYTNLNDETDFDVEFPVETMKYDTIKLKSRLIDASLYKNENTSTGTVVLKYAEKGSAQELAVSSYLIRNNNKQEKVLPGGELIGQPSSSADFNIENYYSTTDKRGKTTLLGVEFFGDDLNPADKTSYSFEYGYNPSYDEIHKREIVRAYHFPSVRQGYGNLAVHPLNKAEHAIPSYQEKLLGANGLNASTTTHSSISPYDFLIDFPYEESRYKFDASSTALDLYVVNQMTGPAYPLLKDPVVHPLKPVKDVFGFLYAENCSTCPAAWSLTKITYPTGGQVQFEYEQGSYSVNTDSPNWNLHENDIPVLKEYNALAKKRSYIQDAYNHYYASSYTTLSPKTLTATYEVPLPSVYGVRLKSKSVNDRINPAVLTSYEYGTGHFTSLPSAYVQSYVGGFNQFMIRENHRHSAEEGHYLGSGSGLTYDFQDKMSYLSYTNISLDDYESVSFYESIKTKYADLSFKKTIYGSISGNGIDYPVYHLICYRLPSASWNAKLTLAGDNVGRSPVSVLREENYNAYGSTPYDKTEFVYQRDELLVRSLAVDYTVQTNNPNTVKLWNNDFEIWTPDIQGVWHTYASIPLMVHDELYLPYNNNNVYSYERWGQFKTKLLQKKTNYKGLIATTDYTYDPSSYVLRSEKASTVNDPNVYFKVYEYAHETYNTLTPKFSNLNLRNIPSKTTTYLNTISDATALSAAVTTFDYSYDVPKTLDTYQYETAAINHDNGTFTLPSFSTNDPNWRISQTDAYEYNHHAFPVSSRSNQLFNKVVTGNHVNLVKAAFSSPERRFDATYSGFEDFFNRFDIAADWDNESYLKEEWHSQEVTPHTTAVRLGAAQTKTCPNAQRFVEVAVIQGQLVYTDYFSVFSTSDISQLGVGEPVEVAITYNNNTTNFNTTIAAIIPKTAYPNDPDIVSNANTYLVCFTNSVQMVNLDFDDVIINVPQVVLNTKHYYDLSGTYARTGKYSYKLHTIRDDEDDPKKTPLRPVKIDQMLIATECMGSESPGDGDSRGGPQLPASCYWNYEASVWLKYDNDIPSLNPAPLPFVVRSSDSSADSIYQRGDVSTTIYQGVKIVCDIWNSDRTSLIQQKIFYPTGLTSDWKQFTVTIPLYKGPQQWLDVYVVNELQQLNVSPGNAKSVFVDDIVVYPKDGRYNYKVFDKFANSTFVVNNNDVFIQNMYDGKARSVGTRNPYRSVTQEISYFDHPSNWNNQNNYLTERKWIGTNSYHETRFYLDGFGKTKQAMVSDNVRGIRIVPETNVYNTKGQVYQSFKSYYLNGSGFGAKYDAGYASKVEALYGSDHGYTEVIFEAKPDEKISAVYQPRMNSESPVVSFQSDATNTTTLVNPYWSANASYAPGTLIVHERINELGNISKTFIDNLGRVIMEEHQIGNSHAQNADGSTTILTVGSSYARTWFVYDGANRLIKVYDPEGKLSEYFYNSLGLVVKSVLPDKGITEMRYDKYGQVRFSRNSKDLEAIQGNIYGCDQFRFSKYDKWGRVYESGVLTVAPTIPGVNPSNPPFPTAEFFDDYSVINNQAFPGSNQPFVQVHTGTQYDGTREAYSSDAVLQHSVYSNHTFDATIYKYAAGKTDVTSYQYMADGQLAKTSYAYDGLTGYHEIKPVYNKLRMPVGKDYVNYLNGDHNFKWRTTIDNFGRPVLNSCIKNGVSTQAGKSYYDPLGNLLMTGVGTTGNNNNPHVDYQAIKLDIRNQVISQMSRYFRLGLTYNAAGNITNQYWSNQYFDPASSSTNINQYEYTYDKMKRLIGADYKQSTLTYNPFNYYNSVIGNFPDEFSCTVEATELDLFLAPVYAEFENNIINGVQVAYSTESIKSLKELQNLYTSNNVPYQTMSDGEKDQFLTGFISTCSAKRINVASYEYYKATLANDQEHITYLNTHTNGPGSLKYTKLIIQAFPFITDRDCVPNGASTVYGYLPPFVTPTAASNSTKYDAAYWYAANGNLTILNRNNETGVKTQQAYTYSNPLNNKLTGVTWYPAGASSFSHNYGYDACGNLLNDSRNNVSAITYSSFHDLPVAITNNNSTHQYRYSIDQQRSVKQLSPTDLEYYIDGVIVDASGNVKSYQTAQGYAVPTVSGAADYFYDVKDWLGTNRAIIDADGAVQNAADYYPYGKKLPGRNYFSTTYEGYRYQFTGHEQDGETGYQYHGARYYNEELARYMSVDPWANKYMGWSTYVYANANPVSVIDPTGKGGIVLQTTDADGNPMLIVHAHYVFYGDGDQEWATKEGAKIQKMWNDAKGTVKIDGVKYKVQFLITAEYKADLSKEEVESNTDVSKNFVRLDKNYTAFPAMIEGISTDEDPEPEITGNSGIWNPDAVTRNQTTGAHETGHVFGLKHEEGTQWGCQPGIMVIKGTPVEAPYAKDKSQRSYVVDTPTPHYENTIDVRTRVITPYDIDALGLENLNFVNGKATLGGMTNIFHEPPVKKP